MMDTTPSKKEKCLTEIEHKYNIDFDSETDYEIIGER